MSNWTGHRKKMSRKIYITYILTNRIRYNRTKIDLETTHRHLKSTFKSLRNCKRR